MSGRSIWSGSETANSLLEMYNMGQATDSKSLYSYNNENTFDLPLKVLIKFQNYYPFLLIY